MRLVFIKFKQDFHDLLSMSGSVMTKTPSIGDVLDTNDPGSKVRFLFLFTYEPLQSF
jgi:hypothetical protein